MEDYQLERSVRQMGKEFMTPDEELAQWKKIAGIRETRSQSTSSQEKLKFNVVKKKNALSIELFLNDEFIGHYQYNNNTNRHITEVGIEYRGKGYGKLLLLKALETATELGFNFVEDDSRTADYDNMVDSLEDSGFVLRDDEYLYLTQDGLDYLNKAESNLHETKEQIKFGTPEWFNRPVNAEHMPAGFRGRVKK